MPASPAHAIPQSPSGTIGTGQKKERDFLQLSILITMQVTLICRIIILYQDITLELTFTFIVCWLNSNLQ